MDQVERLMDYPAKPTGARRLDDELLAVFTERYVDTAPENEPRPSEGVPADATGVTEQEAQAASAARPVSDRNPAGIRTIEEAEQKDETTNR